MPHELAHASTEREAIDESERKDCYEEEKEIWDYRNPNTFGEPESSDEEQPKPDDPLPTEKMI